MKKYLQKCLLLIQVKKGCCTIIVHNNFAFGWIGQWQNQLMFRTIHSKVLLSWVYQPLDYEPGVLLCVAQWRHYICTSKASVSQAGWVWCCELQPSPITTRERLSCSEPANHFLCILMIFILFKCLCHHVSSSHSSGCMAVSSVRHGQRLFQFEGGINCCLKTGQGFGIWCFGCLQGFRCTQQHQPPLSFAWGKSSKVVCCSFPQNFPPYSHPASAFCTVLFGRAPAWLLTRGTCAVGFLCTSLFQPLWGDPCDGASAVSALWLLVQKRD